MINMDCGPEGVCVAGSAGGTTIDIYKTVKRVPFAGEAVSLKVRGLKGGHSGGDIDKEMCIRDRDCEEGLRIPLRLTHQQIADIVHSDRVTVARIISELVKNDLVTKVRGCLILVDVNHLCDLSLIHIFRCGILKGSMEFRWI